jgi:hypothetical protein
MTGRVVVEVEAVCDGKDNWLTVAEHLTELARGELFLHLKTTTYELGLVGVQREPFATGYDGAREYLYTAAFEVIP